MDLLYIMKNMKKVALIMAGGRGERFWPRSRRNFPKQFLRLTDDGKTMIQLTVERILPLVSVEDIYIVTNRAYKALVQEQIPNLPEENILSEPMGRNTAPCIGLGAITISRKYEDAIMMVLPSDHLIKFNNMFRNVLDEGCTIAESGKNLVTIGITPTHPETGYGYVKFKSDGSVGNAYEVDRFVEKPTLELAKEYLTTEEYLWNSGMFIWRVSTIMENLQKFLPDTYEHLLKIGNAIGSDREKTVLEQEFLSMQSQSIDYGVMEKAENIYVLPGTFGWDDVGSWLSLGRIKKSNESGNVVEGNIITVETRNCIIQGEEKLIATVGLENLIIVDTKDALLICAKDSTGNIKKVVENLKICNREKYI